MEYLQTLLNAGLSEPEARVYLATVEFGPALYSTIAEKAGIKRPTLYYEVLPSLLKKGLLTETVKGKRKYLAAGDIKLFLDNKRGQLNEAEKLIPQLQLLLATATSKPTILFYEGIEGIKKAWFDHLAQRQPILELSSIEVIHPDLYKYLKNYYIIERVKRRISEKMLVSGPTLTESFRIKTDPYALREVRIIDHKIFPIPSVCDIYGDNVSFVLHRRDSEPIAMIVRSKEIATTMRSVFNFIWKRATKTA